MFGEMPDWYVDFIDLEDIAVRLRCSVLEVTKHPREAAIARWAIWAERAARADLKARGAKG